MHFYVKIWLAGCCHRYRWTFSQQEFLKFYTFFDFPKQRNNILKLTKPLKTFAIFFSFLWAALEATRLRFKLFSQACRVYAQEFTRI